jgi:hypothetical protein
MIAALVLGVERRSGPLWIAAAASLKAFPILYVLVYVGRREWWKAAVTFVLTGVLVAPFVLYSLEHYPTSAGGAGVLITWPVVYVVVVAVSAGVALWLGRTRYGWLAAAATVCLALPRFFLYDVTYLLVGTVPLNDSDSEDELGTRTRRGIASSMTPPGSSEKFG